ncbi:MAG: hypothetical protein ACKOX3_03040 [Bacteroidota bacterium]
MVKVIARIISILFHPLVVIIAFSAIYIKEMYGAELANMVMWLIGIIAIIPIVIYNSVQLVRGKITNFDLSNQVERNKTYPMLLTILLLLVLSGVYYDLPDQIIYALFVYSLMITVFYFFRNKLKISLHASTSFFLTSMMLFVFFNAGMIAFVISILISASRIVLKRHTLTEVIVGGGSGIVSGLIAGMIH